MRRAKPASPNFVSGSLRLVGARDGRGSSCFPAPTHVDPEPKAGYLLRQRRPTTTARDAIGELEEDDEPALRPRGKWAGTSLPLDPRGGKTTSGTRSVARGSLYSVGAALLELPVGSWQSTLLDDSGAARPRDRAFPLEEPAPLRACSFAGYRPSPTATGCWAISPRYNGSSGNAVPSALAETLARAMRRQLLGDSVSPDPLLIPSPKSRIPGPWSPLPLYRSSIAIWLVEHESAPGDGLGLRCETKKRASFAAQKRALAWRLPRANLRGLKALPSLPSPVPDLSGAPRGPGAPAGFHARSVEGRRLSDPFPALLPPRRLFGSPLRPRRESAWASSPMPS